MRASGVWTLAFILCLAPSAPADDQPDPPATCLDKDKTGMPWVHPFAEAKATAEAKQRLLLIKPVAFGTTPDGGW